MRTFVPTVLESAAARGCVNGKPYALGALLVAAALLAGCGNPVEDAAAATREAVAEWGSAAAEADPADRVAAYGQIIATLEEIAEDYAETPAGQAIATGRSLGSLSLPEMMRVRDDLAARAPCYARPTAECLTPFASRSFEGSAADPNDNLVFINQIVCQRGYAAAEAAIAHLRINQPAYAAQLLNVAHQAASCGNADAVERAIAAYLGADPAAGRERVGNQLRIIATGGLEAGWPAALAALETSVAAPGVDEGTQATAALTMAIAYAGLGDARAALAKYTHFTDSLGYAADLDSRRSLAAQLMLNGAAAAALPIARDRTNSGYSPEALTIWAAHEAAVTVAQRASVIEDQPLPRVIGLGDVREVLGPLESAEAARHSRDAATVEAVLDTLAPTATVDNLGIGNPGLDGAYLLVALVHQKAGDPAKANATLAKVETLRQRLVPGTLQQRGQNEHAVARTLIALAQGKPEEAAGYARNASYRNYIGRPIARELALQGKAELALNVASEFGIDLRSFELSRPIVQGLIEAGEPAKAEQVIAALPMDANVRASFYWEMVAKAAADGERRAAQAIAEKHGLLNTPADRLRLLHLFMGSDELARDRGDAEPVIREIFALGRQLEAAGANGLLAQEAARLAFHNGHIELGLELYRAAERKDQTPLFAAFKDGLRPRDLSAILMLAHDYLQGETRGYVIDAAIRHLTRAG